MLLCGLPGVLLAAELKPQLVADQGAPFCIDRALLDGITPPESKDQPLVVAGCTVIGMKGAKIVVLEPGDQVEKVKLYSRDGNTSYVGYMLKDSVIDANPKALKGPATVGAEGIPLTPPSPKAETSALLGGPKPQGLIPMKPPPESAGVIKTPTIISTGTGTSGITTAAGITGTNAMTGMTTPTGNAAVSGTIGAFGTTSNIGNSGIGGTETGAATNNPCAATAQLGGAGLGGGVSSCR